MPLCLRSWPVSSPVTVVWEGIAWACWYQSDTIRRMAMTLRLTDDEQEALRVQAEAEGASMQDVARRAIRTYVERSRHADRVANAAAKILDVHAEAIERLGE